jgi:hypothetical protein
MGGAGNCGWTSTFGAVSDELVSGLDFRCCAKAPEIESKTSKIIEIVFIIFSLFLKLAVF